MKTLISEISLFSMLLNLTATISLSSDTTDCQSFTAFFQPHIKRLMRHSFKIADEQGSHITSWWNYNVETQHKWQDSQCMRSQLSLTLLLIINHFKVTQTSRRTVNIKVTIEIKVQHKHYTTTNLIMISHLLNNRLCTIYFITEEKTIWENSIKKVTVIRAETWTIYQSQRKWLQQQHKCSQNHHYHISTKTSSLRMR